MKDWHPLGPKWRRSRRVYPRPPAAEQPHRHRAVEDHAVERTAQVGVGPVGVPLKFPGTNTLVLLLPSLLPERCGKL